MRRVNASTVLVTSPKGTAPYRNPLRSRLRKLQAVAPKGPHPAAPNRTSLRRAIREARAQLRAVELEAHLTSKADRDKVEP